LRVSRFSICKHTELSHTDRIAGTSAAWGFPVNWTRGSPTSRFARHLDVSRTPHHGTGNCPNRAGAPFSTPLGKRRPCWLPLAGRRFANPTSLRNDQILVDRYSQTGTLGQVQTAFLVHERGILHDREAVGVRGDGRVV